MTDVHIAALPAEFDKWDALLALIADSFGYMDGVIDPPSSAKQLTLSSLAAKAAAETCFIAEADGNLVGCIFAREKPDHLYVGKLAILPAWQGCGIGRRLMAEAEALARSLGKTSIILETRIELVRNHAAFARLGFREVERTSHPGYERYTSLTMRKDLA